MGKITFNIKTEAECNSFLTIKAEGGEFESIDSFIENHCANTDKSLENCTINYRGVPIKYQDFLDDHVAFANKLKFVTFNKLYVLPDSNINASYYFAEKAADCLQNARFFTMQSQLKLDLDINIGWASGYGSQFKFRCVYFGTAATWYSNTFDQLLQAVYWAYELYTSAKDRDENLYDDSWDVKKTMTCCTYEFVVGELKTRGETKVRKLLTSCSGKIEEVRSWANYIKHKGGIEYKYLDPQTPFEIYVKPATSSVDENAKKGFIKIEDFKSPIEIDIDEKLPTLAGAHEALYECIINVIKEIDFEKHELKFGGKI